MSDLTEKPGDQGRLRREAEDQLKRAQERIATDRAIGVDALTLLYRLASSPETAGDAIKLLHELQVHQVELDLQHKQLQENEHELAIDLARFRTFYELAPLGFFVLDINGYIIDANAAGAALLGVKPPELNGHRFDRFLAGEGRLSMARLLRLLREGHPSATGESHSRDHGAGSRPMTLVASVSPCREAVLLIVNVRDSASSH